MKKFKINFTFFLFIITALLSGTIKEVLIMYAILFLHEMGHLIIIKKQKYEITKVVVLPFGAIIECNNHNKSLKEEFLLYISGISVNLLFLIILVIFKNYGLIFFLNLTMLIFNLLPIHPLDGGRLLEVLLSSKLRYKKALLSYVILSFFISLSLFCFFVINFINLNIIFLFSYLLIENYINIKMYKEKYNLFLLFKYLYPNQKLKVKKVKVKGYDLCSNLYKGKNAKLEIGNKVLDEKQALDVHYKTQNVILNN